jgi:hypothetical protein
MNDHRNHNRTLRLRPHYIFGTVALATLLAMLAAIHPRGNQFVAESRVAIESSFRPDADTTARDRLLLARFLSLETMAAAVETLPRAVLGEAGLEEYPTNSLAQLVGGKVDVTIERNAGSKSETVHVRYASRSQAFAARFVSAIANHVTANYAEQETNPEFAARLADADDQIQTLKQRLSTLRDSQKRLLQESVASERQTHGPPTEPVLTQSIGKTADGVGIVNQPSGDEAALALDPGADGWAGTDGGDAGAERLPQPNDVQGESRLVDEATRTSNENKTQEVAEPSDSMMFDIHSPSSPSEDINTSASRERSSGAAVTLQAPSGRAAAVTGDPATVAVGVGVGDSAEAGDDPADFPADVEPSREQPTVRQLNPHWSTASDALLGARRKLEHALQTYTVNHPTIIAWADQIKTLEQVLAGTPKYVPSKRTPLGPSLTPVPKPQRDSQWQPAERRLLNPGTPDGATFERGFVEAGRTAVQAVGFDEAASRRKVVESEDFQLLGDQIDEVKRQLAIAINERHVIVSAPPKGAAYVSGDAKLVDSQCPVVVPFDLLTLFLPAGFLAFVAAIARKSAETPSAICSVADAAKTLQSNVIGTISTSNGPIISVVEPSDPPSLIRWLVFASEIVCVAAAVLVVISIFQIPGYTKHLLTNPFSAIVTSFDFVVQFIRHT